MEENTVKAYESAIREELAELGIDGIDPAHIEACMRSEHGTLDHISKEQFREEVLIGVAMVQEGGTELMDKLAQSYGLKTGA